MQQGLKVGLLDLYSKQKEQYLSQILLFLFGGERGIRTLDTREGITIFETVAFDHSAISPLVILLI